MHHAQIFNNSLIFNKTHSFRYFPKVTQQLSTNYSPGGARITKIHNVSNANI